jgi:hypothetical protein
VPVMYDQADDDVMSLLKEAMSAWHPALLRLHVRVGVLMASSSTDAPPVRHGGYPAAATIRVVSLKDRVSKPYEAEMVIDAQWWREQDKSVQTALMDHELSHLSLVARKPKKGEDDNGPLYKYDGLGRPCLKLRKGDWNGGDGFESVVERHGEAAVELKNVEQCYHRARSAAQEHRASARHREHVVATSTQ